MSELLALRLALLGLLLLFVLAVSLSMRSGLSVAARLPATSRRPRARLIVVAPGTSGLQPGTSIELAGVMTIGRDTASGIVVQDASVSARHAELRARGGTWLVVDLGSTNGTLVDGAAVGAPGRALADGARVAVGAVTFQFRA